MIVACLIALLASCGFRFKEAVEVPPSLKNVHITGIAEYSELNQELKRALQRSGSIVTKNSDEAQSIISISGEEIRKRVLSVDAQGRAAEYELNYLLSFSVIAASVSANEEATETVSDSVVGDQPESASKKTADKKILVPTQKIKLTRDFRFDPNNVLATAEEEKKVQQGLVKFAVRQMLRRIQSQLK